MKQVVFCFAGLLLSLSIRAQSPKGKIDSLRKALTVSKRDTHQVRLLLLLAQCYQTKTTQLTGQELDTALIYIRKADVLSRSLASKQLVGESLLARSAALLDHRASSSTKDSAANRAATEALHLFETIADPIHKADALYWLAASYKTNDTTRLYYLKQALAIYKQLNLKPRIVKALLQMSYQQTESARDKMVTRLELLAMQIAIQDTTVPRTLFSISLAYTGLGDYPKALQYGYRFYRMARQLHNADEQNRATSALAYIYETMGDTKRAIQFYLIALQSYRQANEIMSTLQLQRRLCSLYLREGRNGEALRLAQKTLTMSEANKLPLINGTLLLLGDCYAAQKDYRQAEIYYLRALPDFIKSPSTKATLYRALGKLYLKTHRLVQADTCLQQAWALINQRGSLDDRRDVALNLYQLDSLRGNSRSALVHYRMYTAAKDSLLDEAKNKQIVLMQVQFDTEKKDQEIKSLQDQRALQQARVDQAQLTRNITIAGLGFLAILLWISYNRYRDNQRANRILETKQDEINQKNGSLEQLLTEKNQLLVEKDWMLKEIHHRVKNNLQIITSLLHSQSVYLKDKEALSAIRESQNRVHAMALIHQKLYQTDRLASIPMDEYIVEIIDYLIHSFNREETIEKRIAIESVDLDVTLAVPLGLILNEAVTNSLKHAFPSGQTGFIAVELTKPASKTYRLTISDNGIGLPADVNPNRSRTLGMSLIRGLSKQLRGNLQISQNDGMQISLTFTDEKIDHKTAINS